MILEYTVDMLHSVNTTIMQRAENAFSAMLSGALRQKLPDQKFMEGKFSIQDDGKGKGGKTYLGEDGFTGRLEKIVTTGYAFKMDSLSGEEKVMEDMLKTLSEEILRNTSDKRISPINVLIRINKNELHMHAEVYLALEGSLEIPKEEEKPS